MALRTIPDRTVSDEALAELVLATKAVRESVGRLQWGRPYPGRDHAVMDRLDAAIRAVEAERSSSAVEHALDHIGRIVAEDMQAVRS